MTGPPMGPGSNPTPSDLARLIPDESDRQDLHDQMDSQYDYAVTEDDWDAANTYASYVFRAQPTATESIAELRRKYLCGIAFNAYCETHLDDADWEWQQNIYTERPTDVQSVLGPIRFTVNGCDLSVGQIDREVTAMIVLDPFVLMSKFQTPEEASTVFAHLDDDENYVTLYGVTGEERDYAEYNRTLRDIALTKTESVEDQFEEWRADVELGDGFPPFLRPLSVLQDDD